MPVDKPSLEQIRERAKYCSWHTAHGPKDVPTVIEMYEKAMGASARSLEKSKKHAGVAEAARAEVESLHKQKAALQKQVADLAGVEKKRAKLQAEANELRGVLSFIREAAEHKVPQG
tara:strand:- start:898 stop:1248 length:351 start_codon:yes stop_codon:yes gene_type:complete